MNIKSTYIIQTKYFFLPSLFEKKGLKQCFTFLQSKTCFSDVICSGLSNINLNDARFLLKCKIQETDFFDIKYKQPNGKYFIPNFRKKRTKSEMFEYGDLEKILKSLRVSYKKTNNVFIKNIGELKYNSKIHFQDAFEMGFTKQKIYKNVCSILKNKTDLYGLTSNQSYSHIPFTIGDNLKLRVKNKTNFTINNQTFQVTPKLKINIYPYGLLNISIAYSVTSTKSFNNISLIELIKLIEKNDNEIVFKNQTYNSINKFYDFVYQSINNSIFKVPNESKVIDFGRTKTVNITWANNENKLSKRELLGVLNLDINYNDYNNDFIKSNESKFGRYKNDFTYLNNDSLLYVFDEKWERIRSKPIFNWAISDVYSLLYIHQKLSTVFTDKLNIILEENSIDKKDKNYIKSIDSFISNFEHYKKLPRALRKLFYKSNEVFNYEVKHNISQLYERINEASKLTSKKEKFIDFFTFNPTFMGVGLDLNKLLKKLIKKIDM